MATNSQAAYRYNLLEKLEAGILLQGSEVKSLREGGVQLKDAYADVKDGEVWLRNMHIAPYKPRAREPRPGAPAQAPAPPPRDRAPARRDLGEGPDDRPHPPLLERPAREGRDRAGEGKDLYDKRRSIKDRDPKREIERALSERY